MAINKKLLHFVSKSNFSTQLANSNIDSKSIVFIKDTGEIWTHDKLYSCASWGTNQTNYVPLTIGGTSYNLSKDGHTHSYVPISGASFIQSTGRSTSWGNTNGTSTGAFNTIMGTGYSATWLLSGTSGGTFRAGVQALDSSGTLRFYVGSNYMQYDGTNLYLGGNLVWNSNNHPTTLSGYGITDALLASSYTATDVLTKIKTVDGSGSGLDADTLDGIHYQDILERNYSGTANSGTATGWFRIATFISNNAGSQDCTLIINRGYHHANNEAYKFSISAAYNGGINITQLSGYANTRLIDKIRVDYINSGVAYIELHISTSTTNNDYKWITIGGATSYTTWTPVSDTPNGTSYEFTTVNGCKSDRGFTGNIIGNASSATNISNTGTVNLASAIESNAITITQPSIAIDKPVKLLNFNWYSDAWSIGNIRSGSTASNGLGIYLNSVEKFRFSDGVLKIGSDTVWHSGNLNNLSQLTTRNFSDILNKPTTLSGYGITDGLFTEQVSVAQTDDTWVKGYASSKNRALVYNTSGVEWGYLFNFRNDVNYGTVLATSYSNNTLKMLSRSAGTWSSWVTFLHSGNFSITLNGSSTTSANFYAPTSQLSVQSGTNSYLIGASSTTSLGTVYSNAGVYMNGSKLYTGDIQASGSITTSGNITASNLWGISSKDITIALTTDWQDTGVLLNDSTLFSDGRGTYIIELYTNSYSVGSGYSMRYSGTMAVYTGSTNSTNTDEIILNSSGHSDSGRHIYLRTANQLTPNYAKLQMAVSNNWTGSGTITIKTRRII